MLTLDIYTPSPNGTNKQQRTNDMKMKIIYETIEAGEEFKVADVAPEIIANMKARLAEKNTEEAMDIIINEDPLGIL